MQSIQQENSTQLSDKAAECPECTGGVGWRVIISSYSLMLLARNTNYYNFPHDV